MATASAIRTATIYLVQIKELAVTGIGFRPYFLLSAILTLENGVLESKFDLVH